MNCPNCLSIMYCDSEIHTIDDKTQRMDLHCYNDACPARKIKYIPHMGVFVRPNESWICCSYNLPFQYKNKWLALRGSWFSMLGMQVHLANRGSTQIQPINSGWEPIPGGGAYNKRALSSMGPLINVGFIPISTSDDMHLKAKKLFNRLMNLVVYT